MSDEGGEFDNHAVLTCLRDMNLAVVFLRPYLNAAERVIGTIKRVLFPRVAIEAAVGRLPQRRC